jgi:predicted  nucleic acid-binding Zn-ribbon protein
LYKKKTLLINTLEVSVIEKIDAQKQVIDILVAQTSKVNKNLQQMLETMEKMDEKIAGLSKKLDTINTQKSSGDKEEEVRGKNTFFCL